MKCTICQQGQLFKLDGAYYDYLTNKHFDLFKCTHCESMRTTGEISGNHYGQTYYGSEKGKFSTMVEKIFYANHKRNAKQFFNRFRPSTVLEVGCGRAYILLELKKLGCNVNGIESQDAEPWILNNPDVAVTAVEDGQPWPFPDHSQDLVIIWHVLEHISDPQAVLKEIKRIISPKGTLCISVPNCISFQSRLSLAQWFHLDVPRHLFHFTSTGLVTLLEYNGFKIKQVRSGDITQNLYGWWQTLLNIVSPNNNNLLYRFIQRGKPWSSASNKMMLIPHLFLLPVVIPIGLLGFFTEEVLNKPGSITIYASKNPHN